MGILSWLVVGLIAGFIGSKIVNRSGEGPAVEVEQLRHEPRRLGRIGVESELSRLLKEN